MWIKNNSDELYHYGVLGMKWGVRKGDRSTSFARASKKADKLKSKAAKNKAKSEKHFSKSGNFYITEIGKAKNEHHLKKSARALRKSKKYSKKADKWVKSMEKEFSNVKVSEISKEHLDAGRDYVYMLTSK